MKNASAARIDAISALAQQLFGEGDQLNEFKLRLNAEIFAKQGSSKTIGGEIKPKKSNTGAYKKSANPENQCNAYIFAIVRNEETGDFEPKQCSLSHEDGSKFCKKHASVHGKRDDAASNYHGTDIVHEHTWQVLGSVENGPSYVFTKYHDQLVAKFNQASGSEASGNESDDSAPKKKTAKTSGTKKSSSGPKKEKKVRAEKKQKVPTAKRGKNPYFEFLSSERESIKAELLAENPELKGRDLTTSIAKEAGRRWNEMGEEDKQPYIDVVAANACLDGDLQNEQSAETAVQGSEEDLSPCCDDHAQTEVNQEEEEEENDRIYNESLNVWIDAETQLYFDSQDSETPLGQIVRGKTVAFKTKKQ